MNDLERTEVNEELSEILDTIEELFDKYDIDVEEDEEFSEIHDMIQRIRAIAAGE